MSDLIKIAVDAMGGDSSPNKTIDGIILNHSKNKNIFFKIFGDEKTIRHLIGNKINSNFYEIIHTTDVVKSTDSPLEGAKRGKNTSMWLAIDSVKKKEADIVVSAAKTGALIVISKLNLNMIENIDNINSSNLRYDGILGDANVLSNLDAFYSITDTTIELKDAKTFKINIADLQLCDGIGNCSNLNFASLQTSNLLT